MKINTNGLSVPVNEVRPGNVYPVSGGWGRSAGHLMVLLAITKPDRRSEGNNCLFLIVDKEGEPRGVTHYGIHAIEDRCPVAFVDEIETVILSMRSL